MTIPISAKFWLFLAIIAALFWAQPMYADGKYELVEWVDLMPDDDLEA